MKRMIVACLVVWALGCETTDDPPQIAVDVWPVLVPAQEYSPDASARRFDLQIRNIGGGTLELNKVQVKGDPRCSFDFEGPDNDALGSNQASFIRGWYDPPGTGDDVVMLEIESNSEENDSFEVPICGRALATAPTEEDNITADECLPIDSNAASCPDQKDDLLD